MKKKILISCLVLAAILKIGADCFWPASLAYDNFGANVGYYATGSGITTTNTYVWALSCPITPVRASVWDGNGINPNLSLKCGSSASTFTFNGTVPDIAILPSAECLFYFAVYKRNSQYFGRIYKANCSNPTAAGVFLGEFNLKGSLSYNLNAPATGYGVHIDSDNKGNFAIVFSATVTGNPNPKVYALFGTTDCQNGPVLCNGGIPQQINTTINAQMEPDVSVAPVGSENEVRIVYVNGNRTKLCLQAVKFANCGEYSISQGACTYVSSSPSSFPLYTPRIASQPKPENGATSAGYTVVFKEINGADHLIRGYTWLEPQTDPCPDIPESSIITYNNGTEPSLCHSSELVSEYPVVSYNDHLTANCSNLLIGWNVKRPATDDWDAVVIQCKTTGNVLPGNPYMYNVNNSSITGDQKALSIDARYAQDGASSAQYMFFDVTDGRVKGKFYSTCVPTSFPNLKSTSLNEISSNTENQISVHPNPSNGTFQVKLPKEIDRPQMFTLTGILGKTVEAEYHINESNSTAEIVVKDAPAGLYFLEVKGSTQQWKTKIYLYK